MPEFIEYFQDIGLDLALKSFPPMSYRVYYKMINDDTHIYMLTRAIKTIISKRYMSINLVGGRDEVKDYIGNVIAKKMTPNLYTFLEYASDFVFYGLSVFQKEFDYDKENKKYYIKGLHSINPASINEFKNDTKKPYGIKSIVFNGIKDGSVDLFDIDARDLFMVYDGNDILTAETALKPAYKFYKIKHFLLQLFPVSVSKSAVLIPIAYVKGKIGDKKRQELDDILGNINALYNPRAIVSSDIIDRIDGLQDKRNPYPFDNDIEFLNKEISKAILGNILSVGLDKTVQYTTQDVFLDLLYGYVWNITDKIIERFNNEIIKPLVEINYGEKEESPKLMIKRVGSKVGENIDTRALFNLAQYNLITPDKELESWLRSLFGLPLQEEVEV